MRWVLVVAAVATTAMLAGCAVQPEHKGYGDTCYTNNPEEHPETVPVCSVDGQRPIGSYCSCGASGGAVGY